MEHSAIEQLKQKNAYRFFLEAKSKNINASLAMAKAISNKSIEEDDLLPGQLNLIRKIVYFGYHPSAYLTPSEQDVYFEELSTQYYFTCFRFLLSHNGLRKGAVHVLLGASGKGKSSLIRSIAIENAILKNVFILLSEETAVSYSIKLNKVANSIKHLKNVNTETLLKIKFASELSQTLKSKENFEDFFTMISDFISKDKIDLLIYDNFSTGLLSEEFELQKLAMRRFKEIALKFNIPVLIALHPIKGVTRYDLFLTNEHVRGNSALATMPEYLYTINQCVLDGQIKNYLYVDKARDYDKSQGRWFELLYELGNNGNGYYKGDIAIDKNSVIENLKLAKKGQ